MRNAFGKNFSSIRLTKLEFQLIHGSYMASNKIRKALSLKELQSSGWFQIKANTCAQLLIQQNFEISSHSFLMSILADMVQKST
jgi:hypothetical protein